MRNLVDTFKESADTMVACDYAKTLELLMWIHDNPDHTRPSSEMFRRAYGFLALGILARLYEPAKAALIDLVTNKRAQLAAGTADTAMQADLRSLEEALQHAEL